MSHRSFRDVFCVLGRDEFSAQLTPVRKAGCSQSVTHFLSSSGCASLGSGSLWVSLVLVVLYFFMDLGQLSCTSLEKQRIECWTNRFPTCLGDRFLRTSLTHEESQTSRISMWRKTTARSSDNQRTPRQKSRFEIGQSDPRHFFPGHVEV